MKVVRMTEAGRHFLEARDFGRSPISSSLVRRLMTAVAKLPPAFRCRGHSRPGIVTVLRFIACGAQEFLYSRLRCGRCQKV